jgi:hypothetical protein
MDPLQFGYQDPHPDPHPHKKNPGPDRHQSAKLEPDTDLHQFAYDKSKCIKNIERI